jgi:Fe-S-cluster containining protein
MISLENTLVSDDLKEVFFCCDLSKCKGACCIEGDAGAPLEEEEISLLEDYKDRIIPYMSQDGIAEIERNGIFDYDAAGRFVTPLIDGKECVFVSLENGIAICAIEKAYTENAIPFRKPISCHLYPARISALSSGDAINYHKWDICSDALKNGKKINLPLFKFLEDSLTRKYGKKWYNQLVRAFSI